MSFAYVYVHDKNGKKSYQTVKTDQMPKFDIDAFVCLNKQDRSKYPYLLTQLDGSQSSCQVLAIADNAVEIEKISNSQRFHVPKLSTSKIDDVYDDLRSSESTDSDAEKKSQKTTRVLKRKASRDVEKEIVLKYQKMNKIYSDSDDEDLMEEIPFNNVAQNDKDAKVVITRKQSTHSTQKTMDQQLDDGPSLTSTPVSKNDQPYRKFSPLHLSSDNKENEPSSDIDYMLLDLKKKLDEAEREVEYWKKKYHKLLDSQAYPLTEGTGQKLTNLLNQFATNQPLSLSSEKKKITEKMDSKAENYDASTNISRSMNITSAKEKDDESSSEKSGEKQSGPNHSDDFGQKGDEPDISSLLEMNYKDPGECAKSIVRTLWTTELLQERVVREIQGKNKKVLTPTKVEKGKQMFSKWLKDKGYRGAARTLELGRWNNHASRAIEAAVKSQKKKVPSKTKPSNNKEQNGKKQNDQMKTSVATNGSEFPGTDKKDQTKLKSSTESAVDKETESGNADVSK